MPVPLRTIIDDDWAVALEPVADRIAAMGEFLRAEVAADRQYLPAGPQVLRAFERPMAQVKVLIVGQDPYPTPGHPIGLSFAVDRHVRPVPRSLANIYRELLADTGITAPQHGDLTAWSDQGVLLLNRVLTVQPGKPASHRGKGWEPITDAAIRALVARGGPLSPCCGARTRRPCNRCSAGRRSSPPRIRRRCPPTAGSSVPGRPPGSIRCSPSRAANRSTGRCDRGRSGELAPAHRRVVRRRHRHVRR